MPVFCLGGYSFVICWSPLGVFGAYFALLGVTLGCLLAAFGSPWAPKGLSLASLWLPLAPLGRRGTISRTLGSQLELGLTWVNNGRPIPSKWLSSSAPAHKK